MTVVRRNKVSNKKVNVKLEKQSRIGDSGRVKKETGRRKIKKEPLDTIAVKQEEFSEEDLKNLKLLGLTISKFRTRCSRLLKGFEQKPESVQFEIPTTDLKRKPKLRYRPPNGTILDISKLDFDRPLEDQIELSDVYFLHHAITYSKRVVMVIGAGVSVGAGIPDFRSSNGLFQGLATKSSGSGKNLFDYNVFRSDGSIKKFESMIHKLYTLSNECDPTYYHHMIDKISEQGRLLRLYTQNIDCLDVQLPHLKTKIPLTFHKPYPKCIQLHGNIQLMNCSKCRYITPLNETFFKKAPNTEGRRLIVRCPECQEMNKVRDIAGKRLQNEGILRPRIVLYNEFHPDGEIIGSITESDIKSRPDCLIVTGTTLKIPGVRRLVKEMARSVHANKGYVIWVNIDPPTQSIVDYVEYFDLLVIGSCQMVPGLVSLYDYVYKPKKRRRKVNTKVETLKSEKIRVA